MNGSPAAGKSLTKSQGHRLRRRAAVREAAYLFATLLTAGLAFSGLVLLPSKLQTHDLELRHASALAEVEELRQSIAILERDTEAIRTDPWAVEKALRGRLGYLRPGERVFRGDS